MNDHPGLPPRDRAAIACVAAVTAVSLLAGVLLLFETHSSPELAPPLLAADHCQPAGAATAALSPAAAGCAVAARR